MADIGGIRKYAGKILIKPSKAAVKRFLDDTRELIKASATDQTAQLIRRLNPKLRGWANYYRHVVSKRTFNYVDDRVFRALWTWTKRRHPNKSARWRKNRYFRHVGLRQWVFFAKVRDEFGQFTGLELFSAASVPIVRHVKVQAHATPHDPAYADYFAHRARRRRPIGSAAQV